MKRNADALRNAFLGGLIALLTVGLLFATFAFALMSSSHAEAVEHLTESTEQSVIIAQNKIDDTFSFLKNTSAVIGGYEELSGQQVMALLNEQQKNDLSSRMSVALISGDSFSPGQSVINVADRLDFKRSMQGKNVISEPLVSRYDGIECVVFSVPVRKNGVIKGVLRYTYRIDKLRELLLTEIFSGKGMTAIVQSDGNFIIPFHAKSGIYDINILEEIKMHGKAALNSLLECLKKGKIENFTADLNGESSLIQIAPVGRENWHVVAAVPVRVVRAGALKTIYEAMGLVVGALLILALWTC